MRLLPLVRRALSVAALLLLPGCFHLISSRGGGKADFEPPRRLEPLDIALPEGYRIEVVATGLTFPTAVTFDEQGTPYVTESGYSYGEVFTEPRLLRVESDGRLTEVARGGHPPWTGVTFHQGAFYVAEGGEKGGGRISRVTPDGQVTPLVSELPSLGDHHTNGPAFGPDGALYYAVGTATNAGVVGPDNAKMGWLKRAERFHDIPCRDVVLSGVNFTSENPLTEDPTDKASTGAFVPFGTATTPGQVIRGALPCSGAIFRLPRGASTPELVAWGFRNPYGLTFSPDGKLYVAENGFDERGSRPLYGAADHLWEVKEGQWYGWPDFSGDRPTNQPWFRQSEKSQDTPSEFLLQQHPNPPPRPVAYFGVHSSSNRFDFSRSEDFGYVGQAFVAQFGDQSPDTGKVFAPVGFKVVRVDVATGVIHNFVANKDKGSGGPASKLDTGGLERPIDARFDPSGRALYIVDFGVMLLKGKQYLPFQQTGVLWRVTRTPQEARP
jgi:glucose/arabinose dehydrogenase